MNWLNRKPAETRKTVANTPEAARWRFLAKRLGRGSATTRGRLLKSLGYSRKTNVKRLIGQVHPQRDWQSRLIGRTKALFIRAGQPVISVDAKKSELIGHFKNGGKRYCQTADEVKVYDFPSDAQCKATPYGIYDHPANLALVRVGISAVTSERIGGVASLFGIGGNNWVRGVIRKPIIF